MSLTVGELAERLAGTLIGDPVTEVTGVAALQDAEAGDLSFLANPKYSAAVAATRASAVIVNAGWDGDVSCAVIRVANADEAFSKAARWIIPPEPGPEPGVHPTAVLAEGVVLGDGVSIAAHCVIDAGCRIGDGTILGAGCWIGAEAQIGSDCLFRPHVSVRERCRIGDRVILHNGAVIGSDGFGYVRTPDGWSKIPQLGIVEIGDDVEIGANTTIDRARFGRR